MIRSLSLSPGRPAQQAGPVATGVSGPEHAGERVEVDEAGQRCFSDGRRRVIHPELLEFAQALRRLRPRQIAGRAGQVKGLDGFPDRIRQQRFGGIDRPQEMLRVFFQVLSARLHIVNTQESAHRRKHLVEPDRPGQELRFGKLVAADAVLAGQSLAWGGFGAIE